jgi:hypothetical protein
VYSRLINEVGGGGGVRLKYKDNIIDADADRILWSLAGDGLKNDQ